MRKLPHSSQQRASTPASRASPGDPDLNGPPDGRGTWGTRYIMIQRLGGDCFGLGGFGDVDVGDKLDAGIGARQFNVFGQAEEAQSLDAIPVQVDFPPLRP